ncbi:DUF6607 family protein [Porphyrobacter sp. YT40]|uniref:DUF6607 family protein n=1 Tax=Porphyrobacter sp. YT40 TaxID=2547601 RepID=UPI001141E8A3|nr:DUF6607 family protein [Porphyrobacter sp. YT40]QDH35907.1 hypothetical protein E2E27_17215 [Porphyrobacter sp. YT40]
MTRLTKTLLSTGFAALALAATPAPALADGPIVQTAEEAKAAFEQDRQTILAMAGDFKVTFDMQESTPWMEGYTPLERKISGGYESVRVIEDTGTRIVLQHLLVTGDQANPYVVKHWRQDWQYQPDVILAYKGGDTWELTPVPEKMRAGRWSQTVYQVDDSPRYAGWGEWETTQGIRRWRSNWTARPLARRDAIRNPVYDHYMGINRHQLTPTGWIHWQDNTKMITPAEGGDPKPVVQEYVLNTYERFDGYNVAAAEAYWDKTSAYWDAVRAKWDAVAEAHGGIRIAQEPGAGTTIAHDLLTLADAIKDGKQTAAAASARAIALIEEGTSGKGG